MAKRDKSAPRKQAQGSRQKNLTEAQPALLKGWKEIAAFLGQPVAVAQRWAGEGMPVRREGRYVETTPEELSRWLGRESETTEPVRIATDDADLSGDLKRGLAELKAQATETVT
jgi:hypothetical protein